MLIKRKPAEANPPPHPHDPLWESSNVVPSCELLASQDVRVWKGVTGCSWVGCELRLSRLDKRPRDWPVSGVKQITLALIALALSVEKKK